MGLLFNGFPEQIPRESFDLYPCWGDGSSTHANGVIVTSPDDGRKSTGSLSERPALSRSSPILSPFPTPLLRVAATRRTFPSPGVGGSSLSLCL